MRLTFALLLAGCGADPLPVAPAARTVGIECADSPKTNPTPQVFATCAPGEVCGEIADPSLVPTRDHCCMPAAARCERDTDCCIVGKWARCAEGRCTGI